MTKKRHHYIPKAYLAPFCDRSGKVHVYRKDDPTKVIQQSPDNVGFHQYYYSQPLSAGGYDHETLENLFCEYEDKWPEIVRRFRANENINDALDTIYAFIALQRARVPATRDEHEKLLAEKVKVIFQQMNAVGKLPPRPKAIGDKLDLIDVSIDPHQSLHAMLYTIKATGDLLGKIGVEVIHNDSDIPFLTSDNPVIWFDPSIPDDEMKPYAIRQDGPIMLLFPVAPDLMIYGDSTKQAQCAQHGVIYNTLKDIESIESINTQICRFAYESVFVNRPGLDGFVKVHADISPAIQTETIPAPKGIFVLHTYEWGKRTRKAKWKVQNE